MMSNLQASEEIPISEKSKPDKIAILDYGAGNIRSVQNALDRISRGVLPYALDYFVSDDIKKLKTADKIIFPGVGNAKFAMKNLREKKLDEFLRNYKKPVLGICLGMQLLFEFSKEENTECLGIIPGKVVKFDSQKVGKIPHMGWNLCRGKFFPPTDPPLNRNELHLGNPRDPKFAHELLDKKYSYFVHSYFAPISKFTTATCQYEDQIFSAIVQKNNFIGMQFHPEKSGKEGEALLRDFLDN